MKAGQKRLEWLQAYYAAIDGLRLEELARFLHEQCEIRYPNGYSEAGRELIVQRTHKALSRLGAIHHEVRAAWEEDEEVIFELEVTYRRRDGRTIVRPGAGIFVLEDGLIRGQRLFVDDHGVWE